MPTRRDFLLASAAVAASPSQLAFTQEPKDKLPAAIAALKPRIQEAVPITVAERQQRADKARVLMAKQKMRRS